MTNQPTDSQKTEVLELLRAAKKSSEMCLNFLVGNVLMKMMLELVRNALVYSLWPEIKNKYFNVFCYCLAPVRIKTRDNKMKRKIVLLNSLYSLKILIKDLNDFLQIYIVSIY